MVADFEEGRILSEINDLEEEINAVEFFIIHADTPTVRVYRRILSRLRREKEHQERRLLIHRQRVKESGVKF